MLTKLRFQNWRSLQDVTIENLTPITVLIGANSSGKTNIIDGLKFLREATADSPLQAIQNRRGFKNIVPQYRPGAFFQLDFSFTSSQLATAIDYSLELADNGEVFPVVSEILTDYERGIQGNIGYGESPPKMESLLGTGKTRLAAFLNNPLQETFYHTAQFIAERWQILDEGFNPPLSVIAGNYGDITVIDRDAANLPIMLHFLKEAAPEKYAQLQDDLQLLMGHVGQVITYQDDRETRFYIEEKHQAGIEAPTISAGTARLVAMLTAYYALDIGPRASMPGLVVIEEPDTAFNPGLLRTFVAMLRRYVRNGNRQFILTTHNPTLLDFFEPSEVRVVERDMQGITHVHEVSEEIWKLWKEDSTLGEVWLTNTFGGLAL